MRYFVVHPGSPTKFGPADLITLNQWAREGRITAQTKLIDVATGIERTPLELEGLIIPPPANRVSVPSEFTYPPTPPAPPGQSEATKAWVFLALGFGLCCLFLPASLVMSSRAERMGYPSMKAAKIVAWVLIVFNIFATIMGAMAVIEIFNEAVKNV